MDFPKAFEKEDHNLFAKNLDSMIGSFLKNGTQAVVIIENESLCSMAAMSGVQSLDQSFPLQFKWSGRKLQFKMWLFADDTIAHSVVKFMTDV